MIPADSDHIAGAEKIVILAIAVAFSLLPSLTIGEETDLPGDPLLGIYNDEEARIGSLVKIDAMFENRENTATTAIFLGEIYFKEELIEPIRSNELLIYPGERINLTYYFTPRKVGNYEISGFVIYSKTATSTKKSFVYVLPPEDEKPDSMVVQLGVGTVVIVMMSVFTAVIFLVKRKKQGA